MADYMSFVCRQEKYELATLVLAIYIYNRFLDSFVVLDKQMHIFALTCVVVAGKIEEIDK